MTASLLIRNVRPNAGPALDILIENGRISRMAKDIAAPAGVTVEDGRGDIAIPGLVEAHAHLDKSLWGMAWYVNEVGPKLLDKIDNERESKKRLDLDPGVARQARDLDGGAGRRLAREVLGVDRVHRGELVHVLEEHRRLHDAREAGSARLEHGGEVGEGAPGLRLDPLRERAGGGIDRQLSGGEDQPAGPDSLGVGPDRRGGLLGADGVLRHAVSLSQGCFR